MTHADFVASFFDSAERCATFDVATSSIWTPAVSTTQYDVCRVETFNTRPRGLRSTVRWCLACRMCGAELESQDLSKLVEEFARNHAHDAQEVKSP